MRQRLSVMEYLNIDSSNIHNYQTGTYPSVTVIEWCVGSLDPDVLRRFPNLTELRCHQNELTTLAGLEGCPQLLKLDCCCNMLTSLAGLHNCPWLRELNCGRNQLSSLVGVESCEQLLELYCYNNQLMSLADLKGCSHLSRLHCSNNQLTSLADLGGCPRLSELYCFNNQLQSLSGLENIQAVLKLHVGQNKLQTLDGITCPLLIELHCQDNELTTLTGLGEHPHLRLINCGSNQLVTFEGLEGCPNLEYLYCQKNRLESLRGIENCPRLKELVCSDNRLTILAGIEVCTELLEIQCCNNSLTTLDGIQYCLQLQQIYCYGNQIESLDHIVYLRQLWSLFASANPLGIQTIQVQRFLAHINGTSIDGLIYTDDQNVHDSHIQRTVCESIRCLLTDPKPEFSIEMVLESGLGEKATRLILEFCEDKTVHSVHLLTYIELLSYVWARIDRSEHRSELRIILAEQVRGAECKCFTGRFNRTLSVLVGFYEDIMIEISDNSRIGAIIIAAGTKVGEHDPVAHRELARTLLLAAGYDIDIIKPWLEAIA